LFIATDEAAEALPANGIIRVEANRIPRTVRMVGWSVAKALVRPFFMKIRDAFWNQIP
jgi:hypothetical protein